MADIYHRYRDHVAFFVVYVQEAHPTDGWQTDSNVAEGILFRQHQSYTEREAWARGRMRQSTVRTALATSTCSCGQVCR